MNDDGQNWLETFDSDAKSTDLFIDRGPEHAPLLALGLIGEMGDILTEIKKLKREGSDFSWFKERMEEEIGDFLWYYVRLVSILEASLIKDLPLEEHFNSEQEKGNVVNDCILLSVFVGDLNGHILGVQKERIGNFRKELTQIWKRLNLIATYNKISLEEVARKNTEKRQDRWKSQKLSYELYDENFPPEEQLPRKMEFDFVEKKGHNGKPRVLLSSCGIHIGDPLTDNSQYPDDYRYHDIFHLGYMTYLGWSPVFRGILRLKRKSKPEIDENQDGARATITEEAISAMVFRRAQEIGFFQGVKTIEYDLLKTIRKLVKGLEVEIAPLGQWERAILVSYAIFRDLKKNKGGRIAVDLVNRKMTYLGVPDFKKHDLKSQRNRKKH